MKVLITYRCERPRGNVVYGHCVANDPIEFLLEVDGFKDETYLILNVLPITNEDALRIDGELRGM